MTTISQIEGSMETWSLEEDDGMFFIHYIADTWSSRVVIPMPEMVLEVMAIRARDATPIEDRRQNIIPLRRWK